MNDDETCEYPSKDVLVGPGGSLKYRLCGDPAVTWEFAFEVRLRVCRVHSITIQTGYSPNLESYRAIQ